MDTNRIKKYDPSRLIEIVRSAPIAWSILLVMWLGWMLQPFYFVGMAAGDQLAFSLTSLDDIFTEAHNHARHQGRVYFLLTKLVDIWVNAHPTSTFTTLFSFVVYLATPLSIAYVFLTSKLERVLFLGIFICIAWNGFDHQPPAAYPVVNHLIFPFWAYIAYRLRSNEEKAKKLLPCIGFFLLSFFCFFQYEPVTVMSIIAIGWAIFSSPFSARLKMRYSVLFGVALLSYALTYMVWAHYHPTDYPGILPGESNPLIVTKVIVAYTLGALPFLRHIRDPLGWGDEVTSVHSIQHTPQFKAEIFGPSGFFLLLGILLFVWLLSRIVSSKPQSGFINGRGRLFAYLIAAAAFTFGPNVLLGFSLKYQEWVEHWVENYLTSQLSMYGWCLLIVPISAYLCRRFKYKQLPIGIILVALACNGIALPLRERSKEIGMRQRSNLARWEALDIVASLELNDEVDTLVVPQFYFYSQSFFPDLAHYWKEYSKTQYGIDWEFRRGLMKVENPNAKRGFLNYSLSPQGRFETLVLKTEEATYVVTKPHCRPIGIFSHTHKDAATLYWSTRNTIKNYDLWIARLTPEEFPNFVGIENVLEVFSTLPSAHP